MISVDIHKPQAAELDELRRIYLASFPPEERREWSAIIAPRRANSPQLNAIYFDAKPVGLITLWRFDQFAYIEHFAVAENARGGGIGGQVLDALTNSEALPIVVEVERDATEEAQRRIRFYERHGFKRSSYDYIQPPYSPTLPSVSLWLMFTSELDPKQVTQTLHREVYGLNVS
jgi:ribosomal protein S18 acetylase RimI-like enzyme